jgi:DNA-binding PadR family transcriptional regulator
MDVNNLCLGVLCLGEASGYEIKKMFESAFSHFQAASFGSIYPALAKLTEAGLVSFREEPQEKRPNKKVFQITEPGRRQIMQKLASTEPADQYRSDFLVLMMFAHLLAPERLAEVFAQQAENLKAEIATLEKILQEGCHLTAGMRFTIEYGIAANQAIYRLMQTRKQTLLSEIKQEQDRREN